MDPNDISDMNLNVNNILSSIGKGAILSIIGVIIGNLLGLGFNISISRLSNPETYGTFMFLWTIISIASIFSKIGSDRGIIKFTSINDSGTASNYYITVGILSSLVGGILGAFLLYSLSFPFPFIYGDQSDLLTPFYLFLFVLPIISVQDTINSIFQAKNVLFFKVIINQVFEPMSRILFICLILLAGLSINHVILGMFFASLVVVLISFTIIIRRINYTPANPFRAEKLREFYYVSIPLSAANIGSLLMARIDIVMLGALTSPDKVGIYAAARLTSDFLSMPVRGMNQLYPAFISDLYKTDGDSGIEEVHATTVRWIIILTCLVLSIIIGLSNELLLLFGEGFGTGVLFLFILCIGKLFDAAAGPSGHLLSMTGYQDYVTFNQLLCGILNLILNVILITQIGAIGAAIGTAFSMAILNVLRVIEVWHFEGYLPYSIDTIKPFFAVVPPIFFLALLPSLPSFLLKIIGGGLVAFVVFISSWYAMGPHPLDKEILTITISKISKIKHNYI